MATQQDRATGIPQPRKAMGLEELMEIARGGLAESETLRREAATAIHRTAIATFRAGKALAIIRQKHVPRQEWVSWQELNGFKRSTVNQAIRLFRNAKRESAVKGLSVMAAKTAFGVLKTPTPTEAPPTTDKAPTNSPALSVVAQADDEAHTPIRGSGNQPDSPANHLQDLAAVLNSLESTLAASKATVAESDDQDMGAEFDRLCRRLAELSKQFPPTKAPSKSGRGGKVKAH